MMAEVIPISLTMAGDHRGGEAVDVWCALQTPSRRNICAWNQRDTLLTGMRLLPSTATGRGWSTQWPLGDCSWAHIRLSQQRLYIAGNVRVGCDAQFLAHIRA